MQGGMAIGLGLSVSFSRSSPGGGSPPGPAYLVTETDRIRIVTEDGNSIIAEHDANA